MISGTYSYFEQDPSTIDPIDFTDVDKKEFEFWDIVRDDVVLVFDKVASDQVYGGRNCKYSTLLRLYKELHMFLSFILEERIVDANNDPLGEDYGNEYYIEKYCIREIRKALICKGINKTKIFQIYNLYGLINTTQNSDLDGISIMGIEATSGKQFRIL